MSSVDPCPRRVCQHICIIYDCLFPFTIGGAERWYRALAERFVRDGHKVTYLTLRQWEQDDPARIKGIEIIAVGSRMELYRQGRRRIAPPLAFGLGVLRHLALHGRRYNHVHLASFPFFSLLAAGLVRPLWRYSLGVDWHEVWSLNYWRAYLGAAGLAGWLVQRLCAAVPHHAFCFSRLHLARLAALGRSGTLLPGEYAGTDYPPRAAADPPTILYAGRLIAEKRVDLLIEAFALAHAKVPQLRLRIVGRGPEQTRLAALCAARGLDGAIELPGFVEEEQLARWMGEALAICQPSKREGYGMVVVEAAAHGVPVVVVDGPDNAAVELVEAGVNGLISAAEPTALAQALLAMVTAPDAWRSRTRDWYAHNRDRLSLDHSLALVAAAIAR